MQQEHPGAMIEVSHLSRSYGSRTAVSNLSFTVEKGHIYGFLGPNGAGKTTTMNILAGCLSASEGSVRIGGYDIFTDSLQARRLIGYLPELPPLYPDRTPREYLRFVAGAKGLRKPEAGRQIDEVLAATGTTEVADRLIRNLSKGYRQRVGIAQALLGKPEVILLDEPMVGLDPAQIIEIRELIRELGKEHTVLLSSHILSEVQNLCSYVLILSEGKLVACDTPENLEHRSGRTVISLEADCPQEKLEFLLRPHALPDTLQLRSDASGSTLAEFAVHSGSEAEVRRCVAKTLANKGIPVLSIHASHTNLEDIFLQFTASGTKNEKEEK